MDETKTLLSCRTLADLKKTTTRYFLSLTHIRINLAVMSMCWMSASFNYFMIQFLLKYFPGNIFVNGLMDSSSELIAYAVGGIIYHKFGVQKALSLSFGIGLLGSIGIILY